MAFLGCTHLTKVVLPRGLKVISNSCFVGTGLAEITLPDGLEEIGERAFECETTTTGNHISSNLSSIVVPASVKKVGAFAFKGRENLKNITFANTANLEEFGTGVFDDTAWYQELSDGPVCLDGIFFFYKGEMPADTVFDIPNDVNCILGGAFKNQKTLKKVTIPQGTKLMGAEIFYGCSNLEEVILPSDLKVIPFATFTGTSNLKQITLPDTLVEIEENAFSLSGIEKISIPSSVKVIKQFTFKMCTSLKEVEFAEGLEVIEFEAFVNTALQKIVLPSSLKELGQSAFSGCQLLESIVIPASLETLGMTPCRFCDNLKSVYYEGTQQQWNKLIAQNNANSNTLPFTSATIYCYSETEPTDSGDYWHYDVDGKTPVIWTKED